MRSGNSVTKRWASAILVGSGLVGLAILTPTPAPARAGDDPPGLFGRLFRGNSANASGPAAPRAAAPRRPEAGGYNPANAPGAAPSLLPIEARPVPNLPAASLPPTGPATPGFDAGAPAQRIRPQPRVTTAATQAMPVLTRIALGRSDDGKQFGMFLQVYADGTVIDGEGVHKLGPDAIRPLLQAAQAPELFRLEGHCGAPPTDFIEQVHVTVYQPGGFLGGGGARANSFSFSGNPQGCDPAVRQLHAAVEALVARISAPASTAPAAAPIADPATLPPISPAPAIASPAPAIGLTPVR
jgi:hypothetical protein